MSINHRTTAAGSTEARAPYSQPLLRDLGSISVGAGKSGEKRTAEKRSAEKRGNEKRWAEKRSAERH